MMKVLMKKILFKKKNLHRLYKIHNTFYNTVVLQNIISCQGEQVKKKKIMFAQIHRACISTASPHPFPIQLILQCDEKAST